MQAAVHMVHIETCGQCQARVEPPVGELRERVFVEAFRRLALTLDDELESLRRLQEEVKQRGDECLAMLVAGVDLYTAVGREWELLEVMRTFAHDAEEMVRNTPSAAELKKLYEREDGERPSQP